MKAALLLASTLLPLAAAPGAEGDELTRDLVRPFLDGVKGNASSAAALASLRQKVRVLVQEIDRRAAERIPAAPGRVAAAAAARKALVDGLVLERSGEASRPEVEALVEAARTEGISMRRDFLHRGLICWCKEEHWTKTLSGCPDPCANEQKELVAEWLAKGYTDDEIIARMVAHPSGGPKVRAAPEASGTNLVGYMGPFAILAAAAVIAALALRKVLRGRGREKEGKESPVHDAARTEDDEVGERIERELREMET